MAQSLPVSGGMGVEEEECTAELLRVLTCGFAWVFDFRDFQQARGFGSF